MACITGPEFISYVGIRVVNDVGNGSGLDLTWFGATPNDPNNSIYYNIYYSTTRFGVFSEGPKIITTELNAIITVDPGKVYYIAVRATEFDPDALDLTGLEQIGLNTYQYPAEQNILSPINGTGAVSIEVDSTTGFPSAGYIQVGTEIMKYGSLTATTFSVAAPDRGQYNSFILSGDATETLVFHPASLIDQGSGVYSVPGANNVGTGTISTLELIDGYAPTETWTIRAVGVTRDAYGDIIPGMTAFYAMGSVSGLLVDEHGDRPIFLSDGNVNDNSILSLAITEGNVVFGIGDYFVVKVSGGVITSVQSNYGVDESITVSLYHGIEDSNSNIEQGTADWTIDYPPQNIDAIGEANVDEDGYRAALENDITTDLTASDENTENFSNYDYLGYHTPSIQDTFSGKCVHSYLGGDFNGSRGFNFQDRILSQLDTMLQSTGVPIILLRRKWTGRRCSCISLKREHQRSRCGLCYGSGFLNGFDRYFNRRPISESYTNTQGMIMARFSPYSDDLELVQEQGLRQPNEEVFWTLTVPKISDRDIIVRFEENNLEEFRYVVLKVERNKLLFNQSGKQTVTCRRLDKTDQIYQFPTNDQSLWVSL